MEARSEATDTAFQHVGAHSSTGSERHHHSGSHHHHNPAAAATSGLLEMGKMPVGNEINTDEANTKTVNTSNFNHVNPKDVAVYDPRGYNFVQIGQENYDNENSYATIDADGQIGMSDVAGGQKGSRSSGSAASGVSNSDTTSAASLGSKLGSKRRSLHKNHINSRILGPEQGDHDEENESRSYDASRRNSNHDSDSSLLEGGEGEDEVHDVRYRRRSNLSPQAAPLKSDSHTTTRDDTQAKTNQDNQGEGKKIMHKSGGQTRGY
jgi:hypothetical protein